MNPHKQILSILLKSGQLRPLEKQAVQLIELEGKSTKQTAHKIGKSIERTRQLHSQGCFAITRILRLALNDYLPGRILRGQFTSRTYNQIRTRTNCQFVQELSAYLDRFTPAARQEIEQVIEQQPEQFSATIALNEAARDMADLSQAMRHGNTMKMYSEAISCRLQKWAPFLESSTIEHIQKSQK